jgi:hypothetical protein
MIKACEEHTASNQRILNHVAHSSGRLRCKSVHSAFVAAVATPKAFGVGAAIIYGYLKFKGLLVV